MSLMLFTGRVIMPLVRKTQDKYFDFWYYLSKFLSFLSVHAIDINYHIVNKENIKNTINFINNAQFKAPKT